MKHSNINMFYYMFLKNKKAVFGLIVLIVIILCAIFANFIAPFSFDEQNLQNAFMPPSLEHWFGTDEFGRDIFSRVIYGSRQSLFIGIASVAFSTIIGGLLGLISGYSGGIIDSIIMRIMDIILSIPSMLLAISVVAALGPSIRNLLFAIGISKIPNYARIMRASVMSVKDMEYIEAARILGVSNKEIVFKDILPNSLSPLIVQVTVGVAFAILTAASMSFLGLGIQPPTPEWGAMISTAKNYIRDYPYMTIFPGITTMITILSLNLLGDGLRDALDPKLRY